MNEIETALAEIESRIGEDYYSSCDCELCHEHNQDIPKLVQALRRAVGTLQNMPADYGCGYEVNRIAEILSK